MTAISVSAPFPILTDIDGDPLDAGYVYIGQPNLDPAAFPKAAYWDASLTTPAAQPIRTSGGYPVRNGSPARIYTDGDYSIRINNKNGTLVYSSPASTDRLDSWQIGYDGGTVQDVLDAVTGPSGAASVGYMPAGTGAVATTVQNKLRKYVAVNDYAGVDPSGATDSTVGLKAAFDYAIPLGIQVELEGSYLISGPIQPYVSRASGGLHIVCKGDVSITVNPAVSGFSDVLYFHTIAYNSASIVGGNLSINGSNKAGRGITIWHDDSSGGRVTISARVQIKNILETDAVTTRENHALLVYGRYAQVVIEQPFVQNVNRTNAAGATKGIAVSRLSGTCIINQPYVENVLCVSSANTDADGIAIFGYQAGSAYNARQGTAIVNEPKFINCQGRSFKGQISDISIYRPRVKRTGAVVAIQQASDFDFQYCGSALLHEPVYEYYEAGGVSPFSVVNSSFRSVVFQQTLDDREMDGKSVGGVIYTQVQFSRYALVINSSTAKRSVATVSGLNIIPVGAFSSSAITNAVLETDMSTVAAKTEKTKLVVRDVSGPLQCYGIGYTGYTSGSLAAKLSFEVTDLKNTLSVGAAKPFNKLSGSIVTEVETFLVRNNFGFGDLFANGWTFTFNKLVPGCVFSVDISAVSATGAPSWGASGYAVIEVLDCWLSDTDKSIRVTKGNADVASTVFYTQSGGSTWGTIK